MDRLLHVSSANRGAPLTGKTIAGKKWMVNYCVGCAHYPTREPWLKRNKTTLYVTRLSRYINQAVVEAITGPHLGTRIRFITIEIH